MIGADILSLSPPSATQYTFSFFSQDNFYCQHFDPHLFFFIFTKYRSACLFQVNALLAAVSVLGNSDDDDEGDDDDGP